MVHMSRKRLEQETTHKCNVDTLKASPQNGQIYKENSDQIFQTIMLDVIYVTRSPCDISTTFPMCTGINHDSLLFWVWIPILHPCEPISLACWKLANGMPDSRGGVIVSSKNLDFSFGVDFRVFYRPLPVQDTCGIDALGKTSRRHQHWHCQRQVTPHEPLSDSVDLWFISVQILRSTEPSNGQAS